MVKTFLGKTIILVLLCAFFSAPALARIMYVEVEAEGSGKNLKAAIFDALQMAISQVNGTAMSAQEVTSLQSITVSTDDESKFNSSEKFHQDVSTVTKGVVKEFSIIRTGYDDHGDIVVELVAMIAKFEASRQTNRLRIAIVTLRASGGKSSSLIAKTLTQGLVTQLTQTRKFAIIDRDFMEDQNVELDRIRSGDTPVEELAMLGNRLSADYILVGEVGRMSFRRRTVRMRTKNIEVRKTDVNLQVSYRIIDIATGQVKFSDQYVYSATLDGHVN